MVAHAHDDIHPRAKIVEIEVREDDPVESGTHTRGENVSRYTTDTHDLPHSRRDR